MSDDDNAPAPAGTPRRTWDLAAGMAALGGFVIGWLADWLVVLVTVVGASSQGLESYDNGTVWLVYGAAVALVPLVAVVLVIVSRLRVPFLIGLALGAVVGAGVCASVLATGW